MTISDIRNAIDHASAILASASTPATAYLGRMLQEAEAQLDDDPEIAMRMISELSWRVTEETVPVRVACDALKDHIQPWANDSCARLIAHVEGHFARVQETIATNLHSEVGFSTVWVETWEAVRSDRKKKLKEFQNEVKDFFCNGCDNDERRHLQQVCDKWIELLQFVCDHPCAALDDLECKLLAEPLSLWSDTQPFLVVINGYRVSCSPQADSECRRFVSELASAGGAFRTAITEAEKAGFGAKVSEGSFFFIDAPSETKNRWKTAYNRLIDLARSRQQKIKEILNGLRSIGAARYGKLEEAGFFDVETANRIQVLRRFDASLAGLFGHKHDWLKRDIAPTNEGGLLGKLLKEAVSGKEARDAADRFFQEEDRLFREYWAKALAEIGLPPADVARTYNQASLRHKALVEAQVGADAILALGAVAGPAAFVLFLAAGWHTLPWVLAAYWPLLAVAGLVAGWAVIRGKENTRVDLLRRANAFLENQLAAQRYQIDRVTKTEYINFAALIVDEFRKDALQKAVGLKTWSEVNRLREALEACFGSHYEAGLNPGATAIPDFLGLAEACLARGEVITAAALAVPAFEMTLRAWFQRLGAPIPLGPNSLRRAVDQLAERPEVGAAVAGRLKLLRPTRNLWAHDMRDLVRIADSQRASRVATFLRDLRDASPDPSRQPPPLRHNRAGHK